MIVDSVIYQRSYVRMLRYALSVHENALTIEFLINVSRRLRISQSPMFQVDSKECIPTCYCYDVDWLLGRKS